MRQFPFDFPASANFLQENFIVSEANKLAYALIRQWPEWGKSRFARILYLYGPKGAGKTHLAHIWQRHSQAHFLRELPSYAEASGAYILEDVELAITQEEQPLLHFINSIIEHHGFLLITSSLPPARLPVTLPDLSSRLRALPLIGLESPDDALLAAVLAKHFSDRQLRIENEVISYLLARIERSFAAVTFITEQLDKKALSEKRNITIPLVRELLSSLP